jgi:hypothetical protein
MLAKCSGTINGKIDKNMTKTPLCANFGRFSAIDVFVCKPGNRIDMN